MNSDLIDDRGRLVGTRFTVYHLLPELLDPASTEAYVAQANKLTPDQVAAARAYILSNPEKVLGQHLKIEERIAAGNPPEVIEQARHTREVMRKFRQWMEARDRLRESNRTASALADRGDAFPSFREWLAQQPQATQGT